MKTLQTRVNLVPLISKADMLTPKEIKKFKKKILEEIAKNQIRIYQVNKFIFDHTFSCLLPKPFDGSSVGIKFSDFEIFEKSCLSLKSN